MVKGETSVTRNVNSAETLEVSELWLFELLLSTKTLLNRTESSALLLITQCTIFLFALICFQTVFIIISPLHTCDIDCYDSSYKKAPSCLEGGFEVSEKQMQRFAI